MKSHLLLGIGSRGDLFSFEAYVNLFIFGGKAH